MGTWKLSDTAGQDGPTVSVDGTFGVRYTYLDIDLDFKRIRGISGHKDWFDPLLEARAFFDLSKHWALALNGSVGGFGSDFTWGTMGTIGYRFRLFSQKNNARTAVGYRAIYQDYTDGSGDDKFKWDLPITGRFWDWLLSFNSLFNIEIKYYRD